MKDLRDYYEGRIWEAMHRAAQGALTFTDKDIREMARHETEVIIYKTAAACLYDAVEELEQMTKEAEEAQA